MKNHLPTYEAKRKLKSTELKGFGNFILLRIKFSGYYKGGYLRKEKNISLDYFETVELIQLSKIKGGKLSLECRATLNNESYLVQFIYDTP